MSTQHTPGPWENCETNAYRDTIDVFESKTARTLFRTCNSLPISEQIANAHLISAAPDMLEALTDYVALNESIQREIAEGNGGYARQLCQAFAQKASAAIAAAREAA